MLMLKAKWFFYLFPCTAVFLIFPIRNELCVFPSSAATGL